MKMANVQMESFFLTVKTEWIRGQTFPTFAEFEEALTNYIRFYNHYRLDYGIDYHTPRGYARLVTLSRVHFFRERSDSLC